ncbi:hypothetical protein QUF64_15090 [Anaerolineales bacterium HSG6]|nr:hypothetical protein [Anaerolineales bacterium HSG6]
MEKSKPKKSNIKLWFVTYNIEYQPVDQMAGGWLEDELVNAGEDTPDFVAIGMQEALWRGGGKGHAGLGKYIIVETELPYKRIKIEGVERWRTTGSTKVKKGLNCQSLELLKHDKSQCSVKVKQAKALDLGGLLQKVKNKVSAGEKGVREMICDFTSPDKKEVRVFIETAHLNTNEQPQELKGYLKKINERVDKKKWKGDVAFLMGDLNFRLSPNLTSKGELDVKEMLTKAQLDELWKMDTLNHVLKGFKWKFPNFTKGTLPTYKLKYKGNRNDHYQNRRNLNTLNSETLKQTYSILTEESEKKRKVGDYPVVELGWLDRIGYKIYNRNIKVNMRSLESRTDAMGADHLPVIMKCDIEF